MTQMNKYSSFAVDTMENFVKTGKKCIGIGANYYSFLKAANKSKPEHPIIFLKPTSSYITEGQKIVIPKGFSQVVEEIELGVIIGKKCKHVSEKDAMDYVGGYCAALDLAALDKLKPDAPWALAKGFDTATPVGKFISKEKIPDPHNVGVWLKVNGEECQNSNTNDLVFNIPQIIAFISKYITLEAGDLILTGTPAGVKTLKKGDVIEAGLGNISTVKFEVDAE